MSTEATVNLKEPVIEGRLHVVELRPGDTLVLETHRSMTGEQATHFKSGIEERFPGHKCIIVCDGLRLGIIREANAEVATA